MLRDGARAGCGVSRGTDWTHTYALRHAGGLLVRLVAVRVADGAQPRY